MIGTDTRAQASPRRVVVADRRDYLLFWALVLLWIVPVAWVGATSQRMPLVGRFVNHLSRISCLFHRRVSDWNEYHIQVQGEPRLGWFDVPIEDYSSMQPFGYLTRLHRVLSRSSTCAHGMLQRQRLAEFIKRRHEALHPRTAKVTSIRFVVVKHAVGDALARQSGHWVRQPLGTVSQQDRRLFSTHFFDGRLPLDRQGRSRPLGSRGL